MYKPSLDDLTDIAINTLVDICQDGVMASHESKVQAATMILHHVHRVESEQRMEREMAAFNKFTVSNLDHPLEIHAEGIRVREESTS